MKFVGMSLVEVAAAVAEHLKIHGIDVVVVGGSAITSYVPTVYTSMDVDFALTSDTDRRRISIALKELGFEPSGRIFVHPDTQYTVDFVAEPPYIDQEPVFDFAEIQTPYGHFRALKLEDAIADRVAAFLYWSDSEALDVAQRSAAAARDRLTWERIDASLRKLDTKSAESAMRMNIARERLRRAMHRQ
jgi:3',5'-cyclic AMP phosphodiesterase CpdA